MSQQQALHQRPSSGLGQRKVYRETGNRLEDAKLHPDGFGITDHVYGSKGGYESPSRDQLLFLTTSLIGHSVEVQVKNGSIFTGIFHATSAEKELGIILKMAQLTKDACLQGQKSPSDFASKSPSKTLLIPSKELVQVIAKDVPLTSNFANGHSHEKRLDIMTDSLISQPHYVDHERELECWVPDEDLPQCPELENVFDNTWSRNWNQFEVNEALFGVKSTFDEELYTTKLEKGPQMKDLEREALRIAREIEGEDTRDIHLAEERGIHLPEDFELDEESRFSSVQRAADDGMWEEDGGTVWDVANRQTFGMLSKSGTEPFVSKKEICIPCLTQSRSNSGTQASSSISSVPEDSFSSFPSAKSMHTFNYALGIPEVEGTVRICENQESEECLEKCSSKESMGNKVVSKEGQALKPEGELEVQSSQNAKKSSLGKDDPYPKEVSDSMLSGMVNWPIQAGNCLARPGCLISSASECVASVSVSSGPPSSPSSSVGSLSSEKSTLNPHAKEFKLNPNAKSFTPSVAPLRPLSPASEVSSYFASNVSSIPHIPIGIEVAHSFGGHQSIVYNPQSASVPSSQGYYANGPMYGQQMFVGQPRQVLYVPTYPPEFQFKGREY